MAGVVALVWLGTHKGRDTSGLWQAFPWVFGGLIALFGALSLTRKRREPPGPALADPTPPPDDSAVLHIERKTAAEAKATRATPTAGKTIGELRRELEPPWDGES